MKRDVIIGVVILVLLAILYLSPNFIGKVIDNETINQSVNETLNNESLVNITSNETENNLTENQTGVNVTLNETEDNRTIINESQEEFEVIYDLTNKSDVSNFTSAEEYCASKDLGCKALGLFYREDCGENGLCNFDDIDGATLGTYQCNTSLELFEGEDIGKFAICSGKKYPDSEKNSVYAYAVETFNELENIRTAMQFCKSLDLKCKAVEWFYRDDCNNNGWCGFNDLQGSIIKLFGCGTLNNQDKEGSAMVILCAGKKENQGVQKKCIDSDGQDYLTKGVTSKNKITKTDSCEGNILSEYYCNENSLMEALVNCTYGCEDGKCLPYVPSCTDNDGDGYFIEGEECGLRDCNDNNATIHPNITERCDGLLGYDGIDNNCDGQIDLDCEAHCDVDGDGYSPSIKFYCAFIGKRLGECDDSNFLVNPNMTEVCDDGIDNNCDGEIDEGCTLLNQTGEVINDSIVIETNDTITPVQSISGGSSGGGGSGGGGGSSSKTEPSEKIPELIINEVKILPEETVFFGVNEEQIDEVNTWFWPIFSMILLLIILLVSSKIIQEISKETYKQSDIEQKIQKNKAKKSSKKPKKS